MSSLPEVPQRGGNRQMDTKDPIRTLEESKTSNIKVIPTLFNIQFQLACFSNGGITLNCPGLGCKGSFKMIIVELNLRHKIYLDSTHPLLADFFSQTLLTLFVNKLHVHQCQAQIEI